MRRFHRQGAALAPARIIATGLTAPTFAVAQALGGGRTGDGRQWLALWSRGGVELGGGLFSPGAPRSRLFARFVFEAPAP